MLLNQLLENILLVVQSVKKKRGSFYFYRNTEGRELASG